MTETKYNVYIVKDETEKAVKRIWNNLSEKRVDRIFMWAMINLDYENYSVTDVEVWSAEDRQYENDLLANNQS